MKSNHIMVDLETLDTRPSAIILSIGACRVNWEGGEPTDHFYRTISVDTCKAVGLTESASTKAWWDKQGPEARKVFTDPSVDLLSAMGDFASYIRMFGAGSVKVWGNGSDFDNVILINAFAALGSQAPWRFYNNRCFRTVRKSLEHCIEEPAREGTHHNALDDAVFQAKILARFKGLITDG